MLTEQEARDAYAGDAPQNLLLARMRSAASIIAGLAVRVDENADFYDDYIEAVKSAEIVVGQYLLITGGFLRSSNVQDATEQYANLDEVKKSAVAALGIYAAAPPSGSGRVVRIL